MARRHCGAAASLAVNRETRARATGCAAAEAQQLEEECSQGRRSRETATRRVAARRVCRVVRAFGLCARSAASKALARWQTPRIPLASRFFAICIAWLRVVRSRTATRAQAATRHPDRLSCSHARSLRSIASAPFVAWQIALSSLLVLSGVCAPLERARQALRARIPLQKREVGSRASGRSPAWAGAACARGR